MENDLTAESEVYGRVSAFYLALWSHLDAFSEKSRWLHASKMLRWEEREVELLNKFRALKLDPMWMTSISNHLETTLQFAAEYSKGKARDSEFLQKIEDWKSTMQTLGLEFARLESVS